MRQRPSRQGGWRRLAVFPVLGGCIAGDGLGAEKFWDFGSGGSSWVNASNWDTAGDGTSGNPTTAPSFGDTAVFNVTSLQGDQIAALDRNVSLGGLVFRSAGATAIRSDGGANRGLVPAAAGITIEAGAGPVSFGTAGSRQGVSFQLGASQAWTNDSANPLQLFAYNPVNTSGHQLTVGGSGHTSAAGTISGTGSLVKAGAGTLTLGSTSNSYTGGTMVAAGTLAGSGCAGSPLTVGSGATLAPGAGVGTFRCNGATFETGAIFALELDSGTAASDKLQAAGDVTIGSGVTLLASDLALPAAALAPGTELVVVDYTGRALTGSFAGLAEGATLVVGPNRFIIAYANSSRITLRAAAGAGYAAWAAANAGGEAPGMDHDRDGTANGLEYFMGQAGSSFTSQPAVAGGKIAWPKDPAFVGTWSVQKSVDLVNWGPATTGVADLGNAVEYALPQGEPALFVRLEVVIP